MQDVCTPGPHGLYHPDKRVLLLSRSSLGPGFYPCYVNNRYYCKDISYAGGVKVKSLIVMDRLTMKKHNTESSSVDPKVVFG
jgi:hypothetical protein